MEGAQNESEAVVVLPDFKLCPHCRSSAFRRLDDDNGFSSKSDSSFLFALATWLFIAFLTPVITVWLWQPTKEMSASSQVSIFLAILRLAETSVWMIRNVVIWIWLATLMFFISEFGRFFGACPSCRKGFIFAHAFKANSFLSRITLGGFSIANLRFQPWLGIASAITIRLIFAGMSLFWLIGLLSVPPDFPSALMSAFFSAPLGGLLAVRLFGDNGRMILWSVVVTAVGFFSAKYFSQVVFLAVPPAGFIGYWALQDNRFSRLKGVTHQAFRSAGLVTLKRLPLLLILMIPGLGFKAGIDWSTNHVLNAVEARAATINTVAVPTIQEEKYPWHSPLRWLGVPKYTFGTAPVSLEKPKATIFSVVKLTRTLMVALEVISLAILALLFGRALVSMLIRELIVQGVQLNAYMPAPRKPLQRSAETTTDEESQVRMDGHASLVINPTWGTSVFLKRDLSPTGGVPSTEMPDSKMAFLARLIHHCLVMDRYVLKDTTIQLDSSDGHRFVRWELKKDEVLYFNFAQVAGWTSGIRFDTAPCLQVGMLAQGKVVVHRAYGPGSLIFDLHGEPGIWTHDKGATFTPDRLVACRIDVKQGDGHPDFKIIAAGGLLNSFIGTISQEASIGAALLLDPKGRRASYTHPVFDLIRQTYTIFG